MVYFRDLDRSPAVVPFDARLFESSRRGMVSSLAGVRHDGIYVRTANYPSRLITTVSIVICTYGRPESLNETLKSLTKQTFKDFEVILITEKGSLSGLRQRGLECAVGGIVSFIDDDVYCPPTWLEGVTQSFRKGVVGVSGPTVITKDYRKNRDLFKFKFIKWFYDRLFIGEGRKIPGYLSRCGANSTRSNDPDCNYEGCVNYLEACNLSVKKKEALDVGGFDFIYIKTSEWCEVDLALRLKEKGLLYFTNRAKLLHKPSKTGVYNARLSTSHRWRNFRTFQRRWIRPSLRRHLYWAFIWTYLNLKNLRTI